MLTHGSILVSLLWLVEQIPTPPPLAKRQRGRQETHLDKLFVKALISRDHSAPLYGLAQLSGTSGSRAAQQLRPLLTEHGRFPTRRTWERRFEKLPARLPALIASGAPSGHAVACLGPRRDTRRPSTVRPCAPMGASGTRNIGWQAKSPIPRLTPKLRGASPGITAGGTAGSCIWRSRS